MQPVRRIANEDDLKLFHESQAYEDVIKFIGKLNSAAQDRENGFQEPVSPAVKVLSETLKSVLATVDAHPAKESDSRFGKLEFRDFYDEVEQKAAQWLAPLLPNPNEEVLKELCGYFSESFGNRTRLDYGSGHELNFVCFLLCLYKTGILKTEDMPNVATGVFFQYLEVMRAVQQAYWLEPAGSHGVWGLDDYHFMTYLLGSAQLVHDPYVRPISIHDVDIVDMYDKKNMYFWSISFINRVKTVGLRWHSPMLDDISGVKKWVKVNEGMIKMYKAEVLDKLPIVQHFLFGKIIPAPEGVTAAKDIGDEIHVQCWADCCGIRVPSAVAAKEQGQQRGHILKKTVAVPLD